MNPQDLLTLAAMLMFGLSFGAFWIGVFWFGRQATRLEGTVDRMEAATFDVASKHDKLERTIDRMERATFVVANGRATIAENLADSVSRADATDGEAGEAADAALRTGDTAAAIHARQDEQASPRH